MSKLERTSHILLIVVSLAGLAVLVRQEFFPASLGPRRSGPELVGSRLAVPGMNLPKTPGLALVVAVRSDCHFCTESLPFYREVDRRRKIARVPVPLFFISTDPVERLRAFVEGAEISPDAIMSVDFRALGVAGTPTLAVIDSAGIVKRAFYGRLTERNAREVLAMVQKAAL